MGNQNIVFVNPILAKVMPGSFCASRCFNRRITGSSLRFERIPSGHLEREKDCSLKWLDAIGRGKWFGEKIRNARLRSAHFISGTRLLARYISVTWCICIIKATTCQSSFKSKIY